MNKIFSCLTIFILLSSMVGAASAQHINAQAPGWYAGGYEAWFYNSEGQELNYNYASGNLMAGYSDREITIPSGAASFSFRGYASRGGEHTWTNIAIKDRTSNPNFNFCGALGSTARIKYDIFGNSGSVSINAGHK
jgi:hypothetical protein